MFDWRAEARELELMAVFERTKALDPKTKERIRSKIWARVREEVLYQPISEYLADALGSVGTILGAMLAAVVLAIQGSAEHATLARLAAVVLALLALACGFILLVWLESRIPWILTIAAITVLGIRSLGSARSFIPNWTATGLWAGFVAVLVVISGLMLMRITTPFFTGIGQRRRLSKHPEAAIVTGLLRIIDHLENLETLRLQHEQLVLGMFARQQRRSTALQSLSEDPNRLSRTGTDDLAQSGEQEDGYWERYKISVQQADGSWKMAALESMGFKRQEDDTFLERYKLEIQREDGKLETAISEQVVLSTPNFFDEDPKWRTLRQDLAGLIRELARHIEQGLLTRLSLGEQPLDTWLHQELQSRAQTVRDWAQRVALPSRLSYENLLSQVATITEHAAEEQWAAIPKSEESQPDRPRQQVWRFARKMVVGVVPLVVVVAAPAFEISIPLTIRDPVLTFAVPWILLQIVEFIAPNSSDYLSNLKNVRELFPSLMGKASERT